MITEKDTAKIRYEFEPDYAIAPGVTLLEVMESLAMTQKQFAVRTGLTEQSIIRILKGKQPISYETANKLELVTGVPANYWNNLEAQYRSQLSKIEERERLAKDIEWLKNIPTKELISRNCIDGGKDKITLLRSVLAFFGVSSVSAWTEIWAVPPVAARRSQCFETRPGHASAWIRQGELKAQNIQCAPYEEKKFKEALNKIRLLTKEDPEVFQPELEKLCAEAGVAVVFVQEMKKVPWGGATKWLTPKKAMIILSLRGKAEDKLWFSFFHEAGHVLYDSKKELLINDGKEDDPREVRANKFAADFLIPEHRNNDIKCARSENDIYALASEYGIFPGIVAGRYQHLTQRWNYYKGLIRKLQWT